MLIADEVGLMMRFPLSRTVKVPLPEGSWLPSDVSNVAVVSITPLYYSPPLTDKSNVSRETLPMGAPYVRSYSLVMELSHPDSRGSGENKALTDQEESVRAGGLIEKWTSPSQSRRCGRTCCPVSPHSSRRCRKPI